jgi:hypothetical protein
MAKRRISAFNRCVGSKLKGKKMTFKQAVKACKGKGRKS